jgi:hypothetical protein
VSVESRDVFDLILFLHLYDTKAQSQILPPCTLSICDDFEPFSVSSFLFYLDAVTSLPSTKRTSIINLPKHITDRAQSSSHATLIVCQNQINSTL